jgi:hypothetical protein
LTRERETIMNIKRSAPVALAFLAGATVMVTAAMCVPDEPVAAPPTVSDTEETDPPPRESKPALPEGTLACGHTSGIAMDYDEGNGYWAYCEPALAGLEPHLLYPCPVEDAPNCYWDAATMGNGTGRSFVNIDGEYFNAEE